MSIYERHGFHNIGWRVAEQKDADGNDQFICLLAGKGIRAILKSIGAFHKTPAGCAWRGKGNARASFGAK